MQNDTDKTFEENLEMIKSRKAYHKKLYEYCCMVEEKMLGINDGENWVDRLADDIEKGHISDGNKTRH